MLRKRTRSVQQDQPRAYPHMSVSDFFVRNDFRNQRAKNSSFLNVPALFVGFIPKGLFDCDDVQSPTSPLDDYRVVSNAGASCRGPKFWDCDQVGLRIINDGDGKAASGSKNVIFGPQLRIKASASGNSFCTSQASKSVPKNYPVFSHAKLNHSYNPRTRNPKCIFEIGKDTDDQLEPELVEVFQSCSLDSGRRLYPMSSVVQRSNLGSNSNLGDRKFCSGVLAGTRIDSASIVRGLKGGTSQFCDGSNPDFSKLRSAADIVLSEDYTCVTLRSPNPQKTHIFGDCILGCHPNFPNTSTSGLTVEGQCETAIHPVVRLKSSASLPSKNFLRFCYNCNKNLDGKDIFMYRGEKAFCSLECREPEIVNNEDSDETASKSSDDSPDPENTDTVLLVSHHSIKN